MKPNLDLAVNAIQQTMIECEGMNRQAGMDVIYYMCSTLLYCRVADADQLNEILEVLGV